MKVAVSSASAQDAIAGGALTQLEWLDLCANELEVDGVVFDEATFPRTDPEYLAQLKKMAIDLGLGIAAVAAGPQALDGSAVLKRAAALGAPLVVITARRGDEQPEERARFIAQLKATARDAKARTIALALRNVPGTLGDSVDAVRRATYDVDSSWLRYALDPLSAAASDDTAGALPRTAIVFAPIDDPQTFARDGDARAAALVRSLARFRGYVVLEAPLVPGVTAFHAAIERFSSIRYASLARLTNV